MKIKLNKLKEAIKAVVNEQDLKKGDRISFKSDPKAIWTILGIQGDTYRINQQGERSISYQPKAFLNNMIATGKASIKEQGDSLDEIDNSDLAMKVRADKINRAKAKHPDTKFAVGRENNIQRDSKIKDLETRRAQVMRDMEQEAEPEGGPIADKYGSELNQIDQAIRKLKGIKNENYDDRNLEEAQDSNNKGYIVARDLIAKLRATTFRKFNDDELEEFRKTIANAFDMSLKEGLNEDKGTLNKIADMLDRKFDDLNFDVNEPADRIDVRGSQQDLANFGSKLSGEKIYGYEVFATDDDDRGEIVRIVKSDKLKEGDGLWANIRAKKARGEKPARKGSKAYKIAKKAGDKINKEK